MYVSVHARLLFGRVFQFYQVFSLSSTPSFLALEVIACVKVGVLRGLWARGKGEGGVRGRVGRERNGDDS